MEDHEGAAAIPRFLAMPARLIFPMNVIAMVNLLREHSAAFAVVQLCMAVQPAQVLHKATAIWIGQCRATLLLAPSWYHMVPHKQDLS